MRWRSAVLALSILALAAGPARTTKPELAIAAAANLTQVFQLLGPDFEAATGIPNTTVSRIETGSFKAPRPDKLAKIAQALHLSAGELFAQVGYLEAGDLPDYSTYLATKHPELPDDERARLSDQFATLLDRLGIGVQALSAGEPIVDSGGDIQ